MPSPVPRYPSCANTVAVALGSNIPHARHGPPPRVLQAAIAALAVHAPVLAVSRIRATRPIGPSRRAFANAAVLLDWPGPLDALLDLLQATERAFGRRRARRWAARVLDLDILAATRIARTPRLTVPHPHLARRAFALDPLLDVWPDWRSPAGATTRHLRARLAKPRPLANRTPQSWCQGS